MRHRKDGHFKADEEVGQAKGYVFAVGIWSQLGDGAKFDENGNANGLPEREEENAFDAKELRHWSIVT